MKVLIIGSGGMLGHLTTLYLREQGYMVTDVSRIRAIDKNTILLDILQEEQKIHQLLQQRFDAVINCAALLVKPSAEHRTKAILLNSYFPHKLEEWLANTKTSILQVSTDGVFSGKGGAPYAEQDSPSPPTFYGKTKWLGELDNAKDATVRASFVGPDLSPQGAGLLHWLLTSRGHITGYEGARFNAVTSLEFAKWCEKWLVERPSGIHHLGAPESLSKGEFLCCAAKAFSLQRVTVELSSSQRTDHSLRCNRQNAITCTASYKQMLEELVDWIQRHPSYYSHYCLGENEI